MKNITLAILTLLLAASFKPQNSEWKEIKIKTSAECNMCKEKIETALVFSKGIKKAELDVPSRIITVVYAPKKTTVEKIKQIISNAGYDADDVKANKKKYDKLPECCKNGANCDDKEEHK